MLGSHIRKLAIQNSLRIFIPDREELNLTDISEISDFLLKKKITTIIHCAAQVGGIQKNIEDPVGFLSNNLKIDLSLIWAAEHCKIHELIYFGSSCMYPRNCDQPMKINQILTGELEPTNESYALAKIVGSQLVAKMGINLGYVWRVLILSNLYGPNDNFSETSSHLIAAIIRKLSIAKSLGLEEVEIWGSGDTRREFTYVEDVANFVIDEIVNMTNWPLMMNIGHGQDYSVFEFYKMVADQFGYTGKFKFDPTKPTGMHQKLLDSTVAQNFNWKPKTNILQGIEKTIEWYLKDQGGQKDV